ncbi:sulfotransferase 1B1-like [Saccoglossus kowalevskii]|uniref:Sulfotransferase family cytosolic 1B member 1-like n=1 Tax=Saccoglossus kowalevskii TaxID=10224 RepID=A0ABM0H1L3_SACKO|nr:PREDICTED: sulfotransferase family cytosolic 1B member 1-like [Saccoglossus kowalevskii]
MGCAGSTPVGSKGKGTSSQMTTPPWSKTYYMQPGFLLPVIVNKTTIENQVNNFEVRDEDVFLITYPHTGTLWLCEIVEAIFNVDNLAVLKEQDIVQKMPLLELGPAEHPDLKVDEIDIHKSVIEMYLDSQPSPRKIPTHLMPEYVPTQMMERKPKTIFMTRSPKDVAVSLHAWRAFLKYLEPVEWNKMAEEFINENTEYGSYFEFTKKWSKYKDEPWFMWLSYEDMKEDSKKAIRQIADHIGRSLSDDQVAKVAEVTDLKFMNENASTIKSRELLLRPGKDLVIDGDVAWKDVFTINQSETFDKLYDEKMEGYESLKYKYEYKTFDLSGE